LLKFALLLIDMSRPSGSFQWLQVQRFSIDVAQIHDFRISGFQIDFLSRDNRLAVLVAGLVLLDAPAARAQARGNVSGIWLTQAGDAKIRISKCGSGICGVVAWLKAPIDPATGKPAIDDKNPNPALARRPMIGLPLFRGMRPSGENKWSGQIYNADDGNSYASHISFTGPIRSASKAASVCCAAVKPGAGRSKTVIPRESGVSSTLELLDCIISALEYWIARSSRATTNRYGFSFSRRHSSESCKNFRPKKMEGAGNAGRSMHPQPRV
jgi:uncharacterized protein (DUF2147 family)